MADDLGALLIRYTADISDLLVKSTEAKATIAGTAESAGAFGGIAGIGFAAAGIAVVGFAGKAVQMAGDFQASMTKLVTSAGELSSNLPMVSAGILKMSVDTATSTEQLAAGMYFVESAGNHGANALKVLGAAAMGAKSEGADLAVVSKALTTVMTDYHLPVTQASSAMNGLIIAVQNGKTTLQDLSSSMSSVLPIASRMGISFPQVAGAIDTMTNAGMPAQQATQNLAHVLIALEAPSKVASKAMVGVGLSAQGIKDALVNQGLPEALQMIEEHVGKKFPAGSVTGETALKNIMGGLVGLKLSAMLTGDSLKTTEDNIAKLTAGMQGGSGAVLGWTEVQGNFNFKMDQAKMAVQALMINIGTALLPILSQLLGAVVPVIQNLSNFSDKGSFLSGVVTFLSETFQKLEEKAKPLIGDFSSIFASVQQLVTAIAPAVVGFSNFAVQSNLIPNAFGLIVGAVNTLTPIVTTLISGLANMATFFQKNQVAGDLLIGALVAIGVVMAADAISGVLDFIAVLPIMIGLLIVWASAAWAAAVGMIAATWPILAIAVVIGIVVAVIILAVQHWGDIVKFLQGVWAGFASWFMGLLHTVGDFFVGIWHGIQTSFQNVVAFIVTAAQIGFEVMKNVIFGPILAVVAIFDWLYAHNTYFKMLVDAIIGFFTIGFKWMADEWNKFSGLLGGIWESIHGKSSSAWNAITSTISGAVSGALNGIRSAWNTVSAITSTVFAVIQGKVQQAWSSITGVFASAWSMISGPFDRLWGNISGAFANFATFAFQSGANIIQGVINGIGSMLGNLGNSAASAAQTVANFLGFHSPAKEGPGSELGVWGTNLVKGFAGGIDSSSPILRASVDHLMTVGMYPIKPSAIGVSGTVAAQQNAQDSSGTHTTIVQFDTTEVARMVQTKADQLARLKLGSRARLAG